MVVFALPASGSARGSANDLAVNLNYTALVSARGGPSTETLSFAIGALLTWDGGAPATVEVVVSLPPGIRWASPRPGATEGCASTPEQAVCTKSVTATPGTNLAASFGEWLVVAERPGSYPFEATVTSAADRNPANDRTAMTVVVGNRRAGASVTSTRAGSTVVASHPVYVQSPDRVFPVVEAAVSCTARLGSKRVTAKGRLLRSRATCTIATSVRDRGKRLSGTLRTRSGALVLVKPFAATLR
jgi:hypothetical protein